MSPERPESGVTFEAQRDSTLETARRLHQLIKPLIVSIKDNTAIMSELGWGGSIRRRSEGEGTWEFDSIYAGPIAVGREYALKGPNNENLNMDATFKAGSPDSDLWHFHLDFSDPNGNRFFLDLQKGYRIDAFWIEQETAVICELKLDKGKVDVRVTPSHLGQVALFFEDLDFEPEEASVINLEKKFKIAGSPANYHQDTIGGFDEVVSWYKDQKYLRENPERIEKWLRTLPKKINFQDGLDLIERQAKVVIENLQQVVEDPKKGQVYTKEQEDSAVSIWWAEQERKAKV